MREGAAGMHRPAGQAAIAWRRTSAVAYVQHVRAVYCMHAWHWAMTGWVTRGDCIR